jgi:hypothetical protein
MATKAINRLSTSISYPLLDEKNGLGQGPFCAPFCRPATEWLDGVAHTTRHFATAWQHLRCSGTGEIPASQTTIPDLPQCTLS